VRQAAVDAYGDEDTELWLRYARWEQSCGRGVGKVYWRATKALSDPQEFVQQLPAEQQGDRAPKHRGTVV